MVRDITQEHSRRLPNEVIEGEISAREWRKTQTILNDEMRRDVFHISETTPDMRDTLRLKSDGELKQTVSHNRTYVPDIISWRIVYDDDEVYTLNEYKDADSARLYLKIQNASGEALPKGANITLVLHPRG